MHSSEYDNKGQFGPQGALLIGVMVKEGRGREGVILSSMSSPKQQCVLTQREVMVSAHLMSIQIDDGSPADAFHSLKQKLGHEREKIYF